MTVSGGRLGFGTASLVGMLSERESRRLLDCAYDCGIRYFDTARTYGYGEAERVLGRFARGKRDVTIATKAGLVPPPRSALLRIARGAARLGVRALPSLRPMIRRRAEATVQTGQFAPAAIRATIEMSLRELGVAALDLVLLHECSPADLTDEVYYELARTLEAGTVREFGIATRESPSLEILRDAPRFSRVVQVADSLGAPSATIGLAPRSIVHSVFRHGNPAAVQPRLAAMAHNLGIPEAVLERRAAIEFGLMRASVVLFSSLREEHIAENARAAQRSIFAPEDLLAVAGARPTVAV